MQCSIIKGYFYTVEDPEFLKQIPNDLHLRRLIVEHSIDEIRKLVSGLGLRYKLWEKMAEELSGETLQFEALLECRKQFEVTFGDIKRAIIKEEIQNPHTICKVIS